MHPLNGVSTPRGENMRETCARVLAAALMTGAIATVVGMSTWVDTPQEPTRSVAAPASSVQRSVRLTARITPRHRRNVATHTGYPAPRPAVVTHRLIVVRTHRALPQTRQRRLAAVPDPPAAAPPEPTPPAAPTPVEAPAPADPSPVVPDTGPGPGRHGRGHAYGHEKQDD
jgi:hypothetical protein